MLTYPPSVEGYAPWQKREVSLGKKSGKKSIEYALKKLNLDINNKVDFLLDEVKKASIEKGGTVSLEEFKTMTLEYNK